jgi:lysophospholipase L1-like esterase
MGNKERQLLLTILGPILWLQEKYVRRVTPRMPEPAGPRSGAVGQGPLLRILVAGDSAAAGVGASSQDQALCGQLVERLSEHHTVQWCVLAVNGLDSPGLLQLLEDAPMGRFDVVVLSMGVNDVTGLLSPSQWLHWQNRLASVIDSRFQPDLLIHSAVAPMHLFSALPQPLRWFLGRWAMEMNHALAVLLVGQTKRTMHWHPTATAEQALAVDGFHPSAYGYALWAESLSERILTASA